MKTNCKIRCLAAVIAIAFTSPSMADVTFQDQKDGTMTVVRMNVTPAAEPSPTLRYRLVPRDIELKSGNRAIYYYRSQVQMSETMKALREKFDEENELGRWYVGGADATPVAQLPLSKLRQASESFNSVYQSNLLPAFERRDCDWQLDLENLSGVDMISLRLDEFQTSREICRMLSLKTRLAIAEKRYDDAIALMRQNYQLGGDVARVPLLICGLIGIAIDATANKDIIELIANPDSPNLYWALGELSEPPVDMRRAVHFEMDFGPRMFPVIQNAETTDRSPQEWNRQFTQMVSDIQKVGGSGMMMHLDGGTSNKAESGISATALALLGYTHAKQTLVAEGMDPERVEKMAVGQVIAIYTERNYRRFADDWENLWQVPFAQSNKMAKELDRKLAATRPFSDGAEREIIPMMTLLLPAIQATRAAQVRLDRDVAAIRVIEALRMHAASHNGQLPARLADVDRVPLPNNPATGKPFVYKLDGATAILELPPSDGVIAGNIRYEIRIAPKN